MPRHSFEQGRVFNNLLVHRKSYVVGTAVGKARCRRAPRTFQKRAHDICGYCSSAALDKWARNFPRWPARNELTSHRPAEARSNPTGRGSGSPARYVADSLWDCVINAAAYTNVDQAESEPDDAFAVNAKAPARLASETGKRGSAIYISTDYVFDGRKGSPYRESDEVAPLNVYGASKRKGEVGVCAGKPAPCRAAHLMGLQPIRQEFCEDNLAACYRARFELVVADQRGTPASRRAMLPGR